MFKRLIFLSLASSLLFPSLAWAGPDEDLVQGIYRGKSSLVRQALLQGANPNQRVRLSPDKQGSPLMWAATWGNQDLIQLLLAKGADLNAKDSDGATALIEAIKGGHQDVVKFLLEQGADPNARGKWDSALMLASQEGHLYMVKWLLEQGADPNITPSYSNALTSAAFDDDLDVIKLLLVNGADPNTHINIYNGSLEGHTVLMWAVNNGHLELAQWLLAKGAKPDAQDEYGDTALILAAIEGHLELVKLLLAKGADPKTRNKAGKTALDYAREVEAEEIVKVLQNLK